MSHNTKIDKLWRQLEDAKLQLDFAHQYLREIVGDIQKRNLPVSYGEDACGRAFRVEELAVENLGTRLQGFRTPFIDRSRSAESQPGVTRESSLQNGVKQAAQRGLARGVAKRSRSPGGSSTSDDNGSLECERLWRKYISPTIDYIRVSRLIYFVLLG